MYLRDFFGGLQLIFPRFNAYYSCVLAEQLGMIIQDNCSDGASKTFPVSGFPRAVVLEKRKVPFCAPSLCSLCQGSTEETTA